MSARRGLTVPVLLLGLALLVLAAFSFFYFFGHHQMSVEEKAKAYKALEVQLRPIKTKVCVNESAIYELTAVNPVFNPRVYAQITIMVPPGMVVYAGQGVKGGSGLATTSVVIEPGEAKTIRVRIVALEPGQRIVSGTLYYWFEGEDKKDARAINLDFPVSVLRCK
ncbi:hypothetical protein [Ignicoccus hospitalis]|uniref:Late embryogenesis abundant protein LEA-2 subgroup domain-containing protein n=1 Tax=Ignicoccus hospitalis (strain KIN4/I / DSM 18386 / JCM 14125) TaxID=453591 RepID=A8ABR9_IGNH4|nr:hypothetical protein [Ignicoccus hospitalis]ABU82371.1 hypothetical protein Igni_1195 [Ignicoccus hospitalis KIN4/I]HIH90846.1 hypothetical protein [Desulfurococcaceae archaeon]